MTITQQHHTTDVTVSLVSHGHGEMVSALLQDMAGLPQIAHVVLTLNIPEPLPSVPEGLQHRLTVIENSAPKGFGANHNAAFKHCKTTYFCVLNPDIRIHQNPFPDLLATLGTAQSGLVAPLVMNSSGAIEDSVRFFPTPWRIFYKVLGISHGRYPISAGAAVQNVDWVAGMCMLFRAEVFQSLAGFDEEYFLYYEDVDICVRAWKQGFSVVVCPTASVIHDAQRASHRNLRFLRWHLASMLRFFCKHLGRLPSSKVTSV